MANLNNFINLVKQRISSQLEESKKVKKAQNEKIAALVKNNPYLDFRPTILGPLGQVKAVRNVFESIPKVEFAEKATSKIQNPALKFGANVVLGGAESMINTPRGLTGGVVRTENSIRNKQPIQKVLSTATEPAEGFLNLLTLGEGSGVLQTGKAGLKEALKRGVFSGAKYGAAYGGLGGLQRNENASSLAEQIINTFPDVAVGAGAGAVLGGGLGLTSRILDAFLGSKSRGLTSKPEDSPAVRKILSTKEAKQVLTGLLNETSSETKFRRQQGLSPQEQYGAMKKVVNTEKFKNIFAKWIGKRDVAKTTGLEEATAFKNLPENSGPDIIAYLEGTKSNVSPEVKNAAAGIRARFNELYQQAKADGLDMGYLKNYISHIWKQSPEEVQVAYKAAGTKIGHRSIPTYEEGMKLGLTPKYTNPAQIIGSYAQRLEQLKANLELITSLKKEGLIVPAGKREVGMEALTGAGFPSTKTKTANGETVIGSFYAPADVAKVINKVFSPDEVNPFVSGAAKVSGGIQDVGLAGGVPGTPLNAWTFNQVLFKELPSGRVRGPLKALWVSMTDSDKYFAENSAVIKKMQANNIPVSTTHTIENMNRNILSDSIKGTLGDWWQRVVNEPTFKKFMPSMEIEFWKDAYNVALKHKVNPALAEEVASKATKNFYGIIGSDEMAKRAALGENLKQIFLFAPRYRESIINFLVNTVKGLKHPLAPENIANTRWLAGTILTYGLYDLANMAFTGKHMFQNPPGTEDKLLVPVGNGTTVGVPFASGILTLPRMAYRAGLDLARGDIKGAAGEVLSTGTAMGLKSFGDVALNRDYFGNEITPENAPVGEKVKDYATYIALQTMHPYLKEALDPRYKDDPAYQRLSRAAELPLRFYEDKSLESRWYYNAQDEVKRTLTSDQQKLYDEVFVVKKTPSTVGEKKLQDIAEARILLANPELLEARKKVLEKTSQDAEQLLDPFYTLTPEQQKVVLQRQALNPGDSDNGLTSQNIDWLKTYWNDRANYFDQLNLPESETKLEGPKLETSQAILDLQDEYFKLPSGTGQRTAFLKQHPELKVYWNEKAQYENEVRVQMGLAPLPINDYGNSSWSKKLRVKKGKKFTFKKPKKITVLKSLFKPLKFKKSTAKKVIKV